MEIHLIRHGKTRANEQKLYCGQTDLPLSSNGIAELTGLKKRGIYPKCADLYFTSGLLRAEQTLDLLYGAIHRETLPQLAEYRFGRFEMKSYEELKDQADYQAWITDGTGHIPCPGGDSKQSFTRRVLEGLELLTDKARQVKSALGICHGGVIACIMEHLLPNVHDYYEWLPEPGRGYTLVHAPRGLQLYKTI